MNEPEQVNTVILTASVVFDGSAFRATVIVSKGSIYSATCPDSAFHALSEAMAKWTSRADVK